MTLHDAIQQAIDASDEPLTLDEAQQTVTLIWSAYRDQQAQAVAAARWARRKRKQQSRATGPRAPGVRLQRRVLAAIRPCVPILRHFLADLLAKQPGRPPLLPGELDATLTLLAQQGAIAIDGDLIARKRS